MYNVIDLFSGCGGMSLGFQKAGFGVISAFEYWDAAVRCYQENFNHKIIKADLSKTADAVSIINNIKGFSSDDIIIGGPPCQDFSHAGKRVEAGRASLTSAYANIVHDIKPKYFVMENVDRAQRSKAYSVARQTFKSAGYGLTEVVLDASLCGVPQKRKRFFCIGALGESDGFLLDYINSHLSKHSTTVREYCVAQNITLDFEYYYRHPRNYSRRGIFSIDESAPTMRGVNRPLPQGYPGHPNDPCNLTENIRALTSSERAMIQTFPADFKWIGSKTDIEQMIGNAVPVGLAQFVGIALKNFIDGNCRTSICEKIDVLGFEEWLTSTFNYSERTKNDYICRVKRANSILPLASSDLPFYIFQLEQAKDFKALKSDVRSQLKRSVTLYSQFACSI